MAVSQNGHKGPTLIYCRVSTRGQEEDGTSLDSQEAACRRKAQELGYEVASVTREVYTGAELWDRPLLARDRLHIKEGKYHALIVYATDRLSRDPIHLAIVAEECERAGVALEFVTEPLDASPEGALIRYVKGYAAKIEREKIKERSLRGKRTRVESGKLLNAGTELYGYRRNKETGTRTIRDGEATIVRQIFRWYTEERASILQITRRLNESGTPSPSHGKYAWRDGHTPRWCGTQIAAMLRNAAYKGDTVAWRFQWDGKRRKSRPRPTDEWVSMPDGTTPAIISLETWDAAQRRLASNFGSETRNKQRPYLLRGLISCTVCGRPRYTDINHGLRRYRCASIKIFGGSCGSSTVPADEVEEWVWERVSRVLRDPSIIAAELERRRDQGPDPVLTADLEAAKRSLARIEREQERLLRQFRRSDDDAFPWELVQREITAAEREKAQVQTIVEDLESRLAQQQAAVHQLEMLTAYCSRVTANLEHLSLEEKRLALEALDITVIANGTEWELRGSIPLHDPECLLTTLSR